ncbi:MAG TPA: EscU/YscU/HrcU family type III secretion system export apparatus switch protein [Candidatus Nanopelagicaceae bacterium]|nr:EscU/YscU/HrcU family type III secretion system export apparatus switch protein [Candidatus Nanopelagicaceae bacterium]
MSDKSGKSEKPTARKLRDARREGQIAKSPEVGGWGGLLAASFVLPHLFSATKTAVQDLLGQVPATVSDPDPQKALALLATGLRTMAFALAPFLLTLLVSGVAATASQGGIRLSAKRMRPKLERFNLLESVKRMFGPHSTWELAKALSKSVVAGYLVWQAGRKLTTSLLGHGSMQLTSALADTAGSALLMLRIVAMVALIFGLADYFVAWRRIRKQLMMTRREVIDEHRTSEGDPHVKAAMRSRAQALARNRMMQDVKTADVVIVNPTHVAVALRYDPTRGAPRVIAKGKGVVAGRIRELATENRIPMVEDVPLARALHAACDLGQEIPEDFYTAVARVLAFVMSLRAKGSAAGSHRVTTVRRPA